MLTVTCEKGKGWEGLRGRESRVEISIQHFLILVFIEDKIQRQDTVRNGWKEVCYSMHTQMIGEEMASREGERSCDLSMNSSFHEQTLMEGRITYMLGRGTGFKNGLAAFVE